MRLPPLDRRVDHEVELVVIIGKEGYRIPREHALAHVGGYAIGLDMTVRGPEDRSWRKSFETFAVIGPWLVTADEILDPGHLDLRLTVNGELAPVRQHQRADLRCAAARGIRVLDLHALSGRRNHDRNARGRRPVAGGDMLECFIEKIGTMRVPIHAAEA